MLASLSPSRALSEGHRRAAVRPHQVPIGARQDWQKRRPWDAADGPSEDKGEAFTASQAAAAG